MKNEQVPINAVDPVCGMEVSIKDKTLKSIYKEKAYYFCSLHCKTQFDTSPERYALSEQ